ETSQLPESSQPQEVSQPPQSSQLPGRAGGRHGGWQPQEVSQPPQSSQPPHDSQKSVDLIASLPEVVGRLELPHQVVDHLLRLLDPYEQAVYIQLYRLSWGFNKPNCSISNPKLAQRTGMPESTVKKTLGKLKEKGLIKKTGLQIGYGKEQGIDFWVAAPSSQLQRSRQTQESSQLPQAHSNRKALKENNKRESAPPDYKDCPDCQGSGFWYPEGVEKGVAKCKHTRLTEGK
ncbi:MAG: Bacteriophage replication protein, partial [Blastocatellia bacterium]|nr:Bacteriophage replication protein [Blastocatellia bacterium]